MKIVIKHIGGYSFDGINCDPDGGPREGYDHRVCPAAIALDQRTGLEIPHDSLPAHWPERKDFPQGS